jgi:hydrogenase maturation protease
LGAPGGTELHALRDPSELATVLAGSDRALIVDAVLDPMRIGKVEFLNSADFAAQKRPLSSHDIDVVTALELGRTLAGDGFPSVSFLGIAIGPPAPPERAFSSEVAAAVEEAARLALAWIEEARHA